MKCLPLRKSCVVILLHRPTEGTHQKRIVNVHDMCRPGPPFGNCGDATLNIYDLLTSAEGFLRDWPIVTVFVLTVVSVLVANLISYRILRAVARRAGRKERLWTGALSSSINPPLQGVLWVIGLSVAVLILRLDKQVPLVAKIFPPLRDVVAILLGMWFCLRMVKRGQNALQVYAQKRGHILDATASDAIGKLLYIIIIIIAGLMIMTAFDLPIASLLAFGGVGGIAVGFAAQGLVSNLFGGLTIYASRPFKTGEWIIMPDNNVQGQVQHIGWRATRVMGFDYRPFYVPNSLFNTAVLINHSRMTHRLISEHVYVRYRDIGKVRGIVERSNQMLGEHAGLDHDFFVFRFDSCGDCSIKLFLYAYTTSIDYAEYMRVKEDVLLKIADIVADHDAELAVPVSSVYTPDGIELKTGREGAQDGTDAPGVVGPQES